MDLEVVKSDEGASFSIRHFVELDEGILFVPCEHGGTVTVGPAAEKKWHRLTLQVRDVEP